LTRYWRAEWLEEVRLLGIGIWLEISSEWVAESRLAEFGDRPAGRFVPAAGSAKRLSRTERYSGGGQTDARTWEK
jgi:hypothetical protein